MDIGEREERAADPDLDRTEALKLVKILFQAAPLSAIDTLGGRRYMAGNVSSEQHISTFSQLVKNFFSFIVYLSYAFALVIWVAADCRTLDRFLTSRMLKWAARVALGGIVFVLVGNAVLSIFPIA